LTPTCADLLESKGLRIALLKSAFNSENFIRRFSWFIFSHFGTIHFLNVSQREIAKHSPKPMILGVQGHSR